MALRCASCQRDLSPDRFADRGAHTGRKQSWCRECRSVYDRQRYQTDAEQTRVRRKNAEIRDRNAQHIYGYLLCHPCVDCDEQDLLVLDFDHVRGKKLFDVTRAIRDTRSIESIDREIAKCEVRCANCHRRKTSTSFVRKLARLKLLVVG